MIRAPSLRDVSFVAANMRAADRREIEASVGPFQPEALAMRALRWPGMTYVATIGDQPAIACGVVIGPDQPHLGYAWAFGTDRMRRAVPDLSRFMAGEWREALIARGVHRVEVRTIADHDLSHRWLNSLGARFEAELINHGRNREPFHLYAWTV